MNQHTFRVIEFDKVCQMASAFSVTEPGRVLTRGIKPLGTLDEVNNQIELVSECRKLSSEGHSAGIEHFADLSPLFRRLKPEDAVLEPSGLLSFLPLFYSAMNLAKLPENISLPRLGVLVSGLSTHPALIKAIVSSLSSEGRIHDDASPAMLNIRRSIKSMEKRTRMILDGILKKKELTPHLQDFYVTERNNRLVIPVKRDSKGSIPGVIHDISNTGETVFVEPYSCQQIGNELESFRAEEKLEEFRILQSLSSLLRDHLHEIESDYHIVAEVDRNQTVARFSEMMKMSPPEINENNYCRIVKARHPVLWKTLKNKNRENDLVPLTMEIGKNHTAMVITGSNAGGKTVALKTIGIVTLMALSGMHVPSESGTTIPFLTMVLTDIGDEQSIEQDLSTYSAHITRLSEIVKMSSTRTMVIIDELGTGTDPEQGGALSCAVLRRLIKQGALTIISTHLGTLKAFASSEPGIINSAMEMEEVTVNGVTAYRPTFQLLLGEPGTSHAFEIAESLGLDKDIIREARELLSGNGVNIESLLSELRRKSRELDGRLEENEQLRGELSSLQTSLKEELESIDIKRRDVKSRALEEAAEIIRKTRVEAQEILRSIKKADLNEGRKIARDLSVKLEGIKKEQKQYSFPEYQGMTEVREGQRVFIHALSAYGVVHSVNQNMKKCKVYVGGKEISVPFEELSDANQESLNQQGGKTAFRAPARDVSEDIFTPSELNLIGQRVDPALSMFERFLNDGSLSGLRQAKIIHGIGTGILSKAVRTYAEEHPLVMKWRKGNEDEGGEAVTIIYF
jgi:DNA mismatch repair protein MutS2